MPPRKSKLKAPQSLLDAQSFIKEQRKGKSGPPCASASGDNKTVVSPKKAGWGLLRSTTGPAPISRTPSPRKVEGSECQRVESDVPPFSPGNAFANAGSLFDVPPFDALPFNASPFPTSPQRPTSPSKRKKSTMAALLRAATKLQLHQTRRKSQNRRWLEDVLPRLRLEYMKWLAETNTGRDPCSPTPRESNCFCFKSPITVTCLRFDSFEDLSLLICQCNPAPVQLVAMGFFPCSPVRPSLAVDLNLLDFIRTASLFMAPNVTGWASAIKGFLAKRQYLFAGKDSLRRRLGNSLKWFNVLVQEEEMLVQDYVEAPRNPPFPGDDVLQLSEAVGTDHPEFGQEPRSIEEDDSGSEKKATDHLARGNLVDLSTLQHPACDTPYQDRPSRYLRERCPCCFGGSRPSFAHSVAHILCAIDACFALRRRHSKYPDPAVTHPATRFVHPEKIAVMEARVNGATTKPGTSKPKQTRASKRKRTQQPAEPGTNQKVVDDEILDRCEDSFRAAQSHVAKANDKIFADTAVMALVCRHDTPLFLANMTSAGERQHYALALLHELFRHLPSEWNVGVLYDVACQLERSIFKHNYLPEFQARLSFAVSVFHAYGHQWSCQLAYHPRKCAGFGFTDGEGCERLWAHLRRLVPAMRSAGYFTRLYTIDTQLSHIELHNLQELGAWLGRKQRALSLRRSEAIRTLSGCGISREQLRLEWEEQLSFQTSKKPTQSGVVAKNLVAEILQNESDLEKKRARREALRGQRRIQREVVDEMEEEEREEERTKLEDDISALEAKISAQRKRLGVGDALSLRRLQFLGFYTARLNAAAARERLIRLVSDRKCELYKMTKLLHDGKRSTKLHEKTKLNLNRRRSAIDRLIKKYETLRRSMMDFIAKHRAPPGALVPQPIDTKTLFELDVDTFSWQDPALSIAIGDSIPRWLHDQNVKSGITGLLELDRCNEEEERLLAEKACLATWIQEREFQVRHAEELCFDWPAMKWRLRCLLDRLAELKHAWSPFVPVQPVDPVELRTLLPCPDVRTDIKEEEASAISDDDEGSNAPLEPDQDEEDYEGQVDDQLAVLENHDAEDYLSSDSKSSIQDEDENYDGLYVMDQLPASFDPSNIPYSSDEVHTQRHTVAHLISAALDVMRGTESRDQKSQYRVLDGSVMDDLTMPSSQLELQDLVEAGVLSSECYGWLIPFQCSSGIFLMRLCWTGEIAVYGYNHECNFVDAEALVLGFLSSVHSVWPDDLTFSQGRWELSSSTRVSLLESFGDDTSALVADMISLFFHNSPHP